MDGRCTGDVCKNLKYQETEEAVKCTLPKTVDEDVDDCMLRRSWQNLERNADDNVGLDALPGNRVPF